MRKVIIESPFAASDVYPSETHLRYLQACVEDCFHRGEAPFASHWFYPQVLDDDNPRERALGIAAGLTWAEHADTVAVYRDFGISRGMQEAIKYYESLGKPWEYRALDSQTVSMIREMTEF